MFLAWVVLSAIIFLIELAFTISLIVEEVGKLLFWLFALSKSRLITRPSGPEPWIFLRSKSFSFAIIFAIGEAKTLSPNFSIFIESLNVFLLTLDVSNDLIVVLTFSDNLFWIFSFSIKS